MTATIWNAPGKFVNITFLALFFNGEILCFATEIQKHAYRNSPLIVWLLNASDGLN